MNVALPEVDGRILSRAVSFKAAAFDDRGVEANIVVTNRSRPRSPSPPRLAANWARLRQAEAGERVSP
jgi:cobaltochelatase CobN